MACRCPAPFQPHLVTPLPAVWLLSLFVVSGLWGDDSALARATANLHRPYFVIASAAKQSRAAAHDALDCFVATLLAMTISNLCVRSKALSFYRSKRIRPRPVCRTFATAPPPHWRRIFCRLGPCGLCKLIQQIVLQSERNWRCNVSIFGLSRAATGRSQSSVGLFRRPHGGPGRW